MLWIVALTPIFCATASANWISIPAGFPDAVTYRYGGYPRKAATLRTPAALTLAGTSMPAAASPPAVAPGGEGCGSSEGTLGRGLT
jgi:hypothetical protein